MSNRTLVLPDIFAQDAQTEIPDNPVPGTSYRNTGLDAGTVRDGWPFQTIVKSENHNQLLFLVSYLLKQIDAQGILSWCITTSYSLGAICFGSDSQIYQSLQSANVGHDPTSPASAAYWRLFSMGVKRVQRGAVTIPSGSFSGTFTLPYPTSDMTKTELRFLGATLDNLSYGYGVRVRLTAIDTVTAYRGPHDSDGIITAEFEVTEHL